MADLINHATWPGITAVESCKGTISHGTSPGVFLLVTCPGGGSPREFGTLTISDGQRTVPFLGCKVSNVTASVGPDGPSYQVEILDRRWRWRSPLAAYGAISGRYNRADTRGKLVPWAIRSPAELAEQCLAALGETRYLIDLPNGLSRSVGRDLNRYLLQGENFRQSLANPEQFWDYTPPAEALARLCDYFGRRVVYQPVQDRILIALLGEGAVLLDAAPYESKTPSITGVEPPSHVAVAGAPVRIQARFRLEAVGREWDDRYVPINDLSYAPRPPARAQKSEISFLKTLGAGEEAPTLRVTVEYAAGGTEHTLSTQVGPLGPLTALWAALGAAMDEAGFGTVVQWSSAGNRFTVEGKEKGQSFTLSVAGSVGQDDFDSFYKSELIQAAPAGGAYWEDSNGAPPLFVGVLPTERLSYLEAKEHAQSSVFKCYRITLVDPGSPFRTLKLPWFGELKRRQQVILEQSKVEQVVPSPRIEGGTNRGNVAPNALLDQGILPPFYNGYSRDQEATVTGSTRKLTGTVVWAPGPGGEYNTRPTDRVFVGFRIDPVEQLVIFDDYVTRYKALDGQYIGQTPGDLVLETGCLVCDAETDQIVRWVEKLELGGASLPEVMIREDLQVGVIGTYAAGHVLTGHTMLDAADTKARAEYYLAGAAAKYRLTTADQRHYIGIYPIDPDGAIQQVSWIVGSGGPTTIASRNSEHSPVIPGYPERRKKENQPPNSAAAAANAAERAFLEQRLPDGRVKIPRQ